MFKKIIDYFKFLKKLNIVSFFYYNYISKQVVRLDRSKIIPYKGTIIDLEPNSKIYLCNGDLELGTAKLKKSKIETLFRMRENAVWCNDGGCNIAYGSTIEVLNSAILDSKFFTMNSNSVMIVAKRMTVGNDVMIARNVVLYDSDFHTIKDNEDNIINSCAEVIIKDHVWLTSNVTVLKNSCIGFNSIVSAGSIVSGNVANNCIYSNKRNIKEKINYGNWLR